MGSMTGEKYISKKGNSFTVQFWFDGSVRYIGCFPSLEEAIDVRDAALKMLPTKADKALARKDRALLRLSNISSHES